MDCGDGGGASTIQEGSDGRRVRLELGRLEYEGEAAVGIGGPRGFPCRLGGLDSLYGAGVVSWAYCSFGGGVWSGCEWSFFYFLSMELFKVSAGEAGREERDV